MLGKHFVWVDTETGGRYDDGVIFSIGLTLGEYKLEGNSIQDFNDIVKNGLYLKLKASEQLDAGRKLTPSVIQWWKGQVAEARSVTIPSAADVTMAEMHKAISDWLGAQGHTFKTVDFWERNNYDLAKLAHMYENQLGFGAVPWDYKRTFDIVQWSASYGMNRYLDIHPEDVPGMVYHNAMHDAALDQVRMIKMMNEAGLL